MNSGIDFEKLYKDNYQAVYYTALQLMGEKYAAEDITQEVFITAFTKYESLKEISSFQAWVKRIAANRCIDELRKERPISTEDIETEYAGEAEPEENFLQEEYVLNEEKRKTVINIMKSVLSDKQFATVFLYYYDELSMAEIAKLLDIPEGTVLSRLSTSRAKIKQGVIEYEKKHGDKLYGAAIISMLALLFKDDAAAMGIPSELPDALNGAAQAQSGKISKKAPGKAAAGAAATKGAIGAAIAVGALVVAGVALTLGILSSRDDAGKEKTEPETVQSSSEQQEASAAKESVEKSTEESYASQVAESTEDSTGEIAAGISVSLDGMKIDLGKTTVREILSDSKTFWEGDIWWRDLGTMASGSESWFEIKNLYWRSVAEGKDFSTMSEEEKEELYPNGEKFVLATCNLSGKVIEEIDGAIIGFTFTAPDCDLRLAPAIDVNGLHFGSSEKEVKAAMGEPTLLHEGDREWYYYTESGYYSIVFNEDGVMNSITFTYDYEEETEEN